MNNGLKITLYVILAIAALWFGSRFLAELKKSADSLSQVPGETNEVVQTTPTPAETNSAQTNLDTNASAAATNAPPASTNPATADTNQITNATASVSNPSATTNLAVAASHDGVQTARPVHKSHWMGYLGAFLGVVIILGLMIAYDTTQFFGNRSIDFLFNEDLKGVYNPQYEEAEQLWANGKPLDAIQAMREYLKKNPREQYVALRIAEIYEKDLNNYLAAALEYEQVLQHKLPRERWGWAAIHLCNLYSKMGKENQCLDLLRRIDAEYGETAAAKKARRRLAMYESGGDTHALGADAIEDPNIPTEEPKPRPAPKVVAKKTEPEPPSNLPPGFRPKK